MSLPALPSSGNYLSSVRESSRKLCQESNITIDQNNIERLISSDVFKSLDHATSLPGVALPLNFASALDELNVVSVLALLNFGTSFDGPLRTQTGHGASNAIKALIFGMYITSTPSEGDYLSANGLRSISAAKIAELIGVDIHIERPHPSLPGVTVGELGGPLYEYVLLVTQTLNETGKILLDHGYPNLGFFVVEALKEAKKAKVDQDASAQAEAVVAKVVRALPAFQDMTFVNGEPVYIFSKAIYLLNVLYTRFGSTNPPPFPVPDVKDLPISADGFTPSVFVKLGIINLSSSDSLRNLWPTISNEDIQALLDQQKEGVAAQVAQDGPTMSLEQSSRLQGAAIVAAETIAEVATQSGGAVTPSKINVWLQATLKQRADYRAVGGIVVKGAVLF
ncbi:hypothetical protein FA13DRAFT_1726658 [Coprinellus micaceus]|uniref:Queuosine 5'-phosphate N-glycosylase/hydrolase n=1 Tax=Coprinellus micaceus TaxID=71717 RepID=A0A4Y7TTN5_COPMI|nr:hypothetical protein FA13DRAFT_1726658 [Coprinellus micaceus]